MMVEENKRQDELLGDMSIEAMELYSSLTQTNKQKVTDLIATLLNQQSSGPQSSGLQP